MTAYSFYTITCDSCGAISDGGTSATAKQARLYASYTGWVQVTRGVDKCGICSGTHEMITGFGSAKKEDYR